MKKKAIILPLMVLIVTFVCGGKHQQESLKEIYKTGKIRFVEELKITNDDLPEGVNIKFLGDLTEDKNGNVFVLETGSHRILKFSPDGTLLKAIGEKGQGPGDLYIPTCMTRMGDDLIIFEFGNERFSLFSLNGEFIKILKPEGIEKKGSSKKLPV